MDTVPILIAVLTVEKDERIRCQSSGCNHPVFKRIHVVRLGPEFKLLGSSCYRKEYSSYAEAGQPPRFTSKSGRHLTESDRELLIVNSERLIAKLESGWLLQQMECSPRPRNRTRKRGYLNHDVLANIPASVVAEARERISREFGINANLSGWYALVVDEVKAILRRNAA